MLIFVKTLERMLIVIIMIRILVSSVACGIVILVPTFIVMKAPSNKNWRLSQLHSSSVSDMFSGMKLSLKGFRWAIR